MSHTPGPWETEYGIVYGWNGDDRVMVAEVLENANDNAPLISAAPDLLEALKFSISVIGHPDDAMSKYLRSVVSKAEGKQDD